MTRDFEYVVWFRNPAFPPDDQDFEWPAVFVIVSDDADSARAWGDTLATDYAERTDQQFLRSHIENQLTPDAQLPRVVDGERAADSHIGW